MELTKLHLGCGPHIFPGWKNYDLEPGPGGIKCDLSRALPIDSASVDFIFSEHFIEHLSRDQGAAFLRECYRVLKPGGVIRISTPDLLQLIYCYLNDIITDWAPTWAPRTPARLVNEGMRLWGHQFIYDGDELSLALTEAGFKSIAGWDWRDSDHADLKNLEVRPYIGDLILEAMK